MILSIPNYLLFTLPIFPVTAPRIPRVLQPETNELQRNKKNRRATGSRSAVRIPGSTGVSPEARARILPEGTKSGTEPSDLRTYGYISVCPCSRVLRLPLFEPDRSAETTACYLCSPCGLTSSFSLHWPVQPILPRPRQSVAVQSPRTTGRDTGYESRRHEQAGD